MSEDYDYLFKSVIVGDGGAGKTAIVVRFSQGFFQESYKLTIGVEFAVKTINIETTDGEDLSVKLQIWDTGGQERFQYVRPLYYKGAMGAIVLFDVTNRESFDHISKWIGEVRDNAGDIPMLLVGNKIDLEDSRVVSMEEAQELADDLNMFYVESSAKTGVGVGDIFAVLALLMIGEDIPQEVLAGGSKEPSAAEAGEKTPGQPSPTGKVEDATGARPAPIQMESGESATQTDTEKGPSFKPSPLGMEAKSASQPKPKSAFTPKPESEVAEKKPAFTPKPIKSEPVKSEPEPEPKPKPKAEPAFTPKPESEVAEKKPAFTPKPIKPEPVKSEPEPETEPKPKAEPAFTPKPELEEKKPAFKPEPIKRKETEKNEEEPGWFAPITPQKKEKPAQEPKAGTDKKATVPRAHNDFVADDSQFAPPVPKRKIQKQTQEVSPPSPSSEQKEEEMKPQKKPEVAESNPFFEKSKPAIIEGVSSKSETSAEKSEDSANQLLAQEKKRSVPTKKPKKSHSRFSSFLNALRGKEDSSKQEKEEEEKKESSSLGFMSQFGSKKKEESEKKSGDFFGFGGESKPQKSQENKNIFGGGSSKKPQLEKKQVKCPNCGAILNEKFKFCNKCGTRLN